MKRKKTKNKPFIWISLKDDELSVYGPDKFKTFGEAYNQMNKDLDAIARHEGENPKKILFICRENISERIRELYWNDKEVEVL